MSWCRAQSGTFDQRSFFLKSLSCHLGAPSLTRGRVSKSKSVRVRVTLQLTVSQSVRLGVEPNLGLLTRDVFFFLSYSLVLIGAPSLMRGRVCHLSVYSRVCNLLIWLRGRRNRNHRSISTAVSIACFTATALYCCSFRTRFLTMFIFFHLV
jgi:hypothetical protein